MVLSVALAGLIAVQSSAKADDWLEVPSPAGEVRAMQAASASTWLLQTAPAVCCTPTFYATSNGGQSWSAKEFPEFSDAAIAGAAPDGSFRVLAWKTVGTPNKFEAQLFRVDPGTGSATQLGPELEKSTVVPSNSAVDDAGATWIPIRSDADNMFKLVVVAADGLVSTRTLPEPVTSQKWKARRTVLGMRLLRYAQEGFYNEVFQGTYRLDSSDNLVPAEKYPVDSIDGEFWLSGVGGASWDGGIHWVEGPADPIERTPGLGMPRFLGGTHIARRYSRAIFQETGTSYPPEAGPQRVFDAGPALVAWSKAGVYVHSSELSLPPASIGALAPDTQRLLARADQFRADAELPPLTGDALVSEASRNHSAYSALHPEELAMGNFHSERFGSPGFTGASPTDRCAAVGTYCFGEVAFGAGEEDPVAGWLATPFHRPLVGSPEAGIVGAGQVANGAAVMNIRSAQNILVQPFGYPNGRWRGADGFSGEIPDPVRTCTEMGQKIDYPVGVTVSLYAPVAYSPGEVSGIQVHKRGTSKPMRGCFLKGSDINDAAMGSFVPDDPLEAGATYDAEGQWYPGVDVRIGGPSIPAASLTYRWSFTFEPEVAQRAAKARCMGKRVTLAGSSLPDVLVGTARADVIDGQGGNDKILALSGGDTIFGGRGRDRLYVGRGAYRVQGGPGNDQLLGGTGKDMLQGLGGRDKLKGGPGSDRLFGGRGRDRLFGGRGKDHLSGGRGRDRLAGGPGRDRVLGNGDIGS
jgi:hypothetical protein